VFFPHFHWDWLLPLPGFAMYGLFGILLFLSVLIIVGIETRISAGFFAIGFAYQHLIDKSNFLNHYYLVFLFSLILFLIPSEKIPSLFSNSTNRWVRVPVWSVWLVRFQLGVVYTFGAIAKMRPDWVWEAQPLKIWLLMNRDLPLIGGILAWNITPYFFSIAGLLFDLFVFPALLWKKSRKIAYFFVVFFHILTFLLFPIGMFPWIMLFLTPVCFSDRFHYTFTKRLSKILSKFPRIQFSSQTNVPSKSIWYFRFAILLVALEIILPFRHFAFPGNLLWTEEGFRFSWHIMAAHKSGSVQFYIKEGQGELIPVNYSYLLTQRQLGQMSTDPAMVWQFARVVATKEREKGRENFGVYVDHFVSLNGKEAKRQIDPSVNLLEVEYEYFSHTNWILPDK
jgi:hypothetical protein